MASTDIPPGPTPADRRQPAPRADRPAVTPIAAPVRRRPSSAASSRPAPRSAAGRDRLEARPGRFAGVPAAPDDRRVRGRRLRLRPGLHRPRGRAAARLLYEKWFRIETLGLENIPDTGGALLVANHSGTIAIDAVMAAVARPRAPPAHRALRMLGADLVFQTPLLGSDHPQDRQHPGLQPGRRAAAVVRRTGLGVPGGLQGRRQAVLPALQAAAVRPRRVRHRGAQDRRADHPGVDRRRRGDLSADRQHQAAGPGARASRTSR